MHLYSKIISVLTVLVQDDTEFIKLFEKTFRSLISSLDIEILLDGPIPQHIMINLLSTSLQNLSDYAKTQFELTKHPKFDRLQHILWNPLISLLLSNTQALSPGPGKTLSHTTKSKVTQFGSMSTAFTALSLSETEQQDVRQKLLKSATTLKRPYNNRFHKHISCKKDLCDFCMTMFKTVNITKCVGHKPCHSTGYYPHVGTSLWQIIKRKHTLGECKLTNKACKLGEIPALVSADAELRSEVPSPVLSTRTWAEEIEEEESIFYPVVRKKRRNSSSSDITVTSKTSDTMTN